MTADSDVPQEYHDLVLSFVQQGWNGEPIHLVEMPSGEVTSIDNARLAVARDLNLELNAIVHQYDKSLVSSMQREGWERPYMEGSRINGMVGDWNILTERSTCRQ